MIEILQVPCMFAIGVFLIAKPDLVWKIENFLYVKDGSPTRFYFILARICGGIAIICSFVFGYVVLFE
ncbi:MAG: DUF6199 family natural product biosynthesis protein [Clostridium sp.]